MNPTLTSDVRFQRKVNKCRQTRFILSETLPARVEGESRLFSN
nr:MAG TPA: hypothetical protein [Caudoviricetes sp.]